MAYRIFTLAIILTAFMAASVCAQVGELTGVNICADGLQSTDIGISGIAPAKYYALYQDNVLLQARKSSGEGSEKIIHFGNFREAGKYTAACFDKVIENFPPRLGKPVKGTIVISPVPVLSIGDTLRLKPGQDLNYVPRADLSGTTFTWSARLKFGKVTGFGVTGEGIIHEKLTLSEAPACIVYSITPHISNNDIVSCNGETRDLVVVIRP